MNKQKYEQEDMAVLWNRDKERLRKSYRKFPL
jgi:hypothetical protein